MMLFNFFITLFVGKKSRPPDVFERFYFAAKVQNENGKLLQLFPMHKWNFLSFFSLECPPYEWVNDWEYPHENPLHYHQKKIRKKGKRKSFFIHDKFLGPLERA